MNNLRLYVEHDRCSNQVKFWLQSEFNDELVNYSVSELNYLTQTRVSIIDGTCHDLKPLMIVPGSLAEDLLKVFAEVANSKGIKTENENLLKGKLEAATYHLEDMRIIVNKLLKI